MRPATIPLSSSVVSLTCTFGSLRNYKKNTWFLFYNFLRNNLKYTFHTIVLYNMRFTKFIMGLIVFIIFIHASYGQSTAIVNDADAKFKQAKELYNKELYSLSYPLFKELSEDKNEKSATPFLIQNEAKFYSLISALQLNDSMVLNDAEIWLQTAPAPQAAQLNYYIAEYYFRKTQFPQAVAHYEKAEFSYFNNEQIAQIQFNQAYSYFNLKRFSEAKPLFNTIRQMPNNNHYYDANYYYGFIAFGEKKYTEALDAFQKVEAQPAYKNIAPYYLAELYYLNGNKEKALQYALHSLENNNQYYNLLLKQLIGYILFEKEQFSEALPYLEEYVSNTPKVSREDIYELSYCYYINQQWTKAIKGFKELSGKEDSLTQNSMYLLADAYLKIGDKPSARNAFLFCAANSSNPKQTEVSLFHYAKLSYELGYKNIALQELQRFIQAYPSSSYNTEAKELLISLLSNTNNFKEALALYESLPVTNTALQQLYPKLLYGRAMEYINAQQLNDAQLLLNKLLHIPYNHTFLPAAYFWKGEIAYRLQQTDSAILYINKYLIKPVNSKEVNTQNAHYTLGYSYLSLKNYNAAVVQFNLIASALPDAGEIEHDAYIRSADCYFMLKQFSQALGLYQTAIKNKLPQSDYAYKQTAIIMGALNRQQEKINLLQSFPQRFPNSSLQAEAAMELANTYMASENFSSAISPLQNILQNTLAKKYYPEAWLKSGVCYFNLNQENKAMECFQKLITQYPNTTESRSAIEYIRSIFLSRNEPDLFIELMKQQGNNIAVAEEDSLIYTASKMQYLQGNAIQALRGFENYITQFPNGLYVVEAHYFSAQINEAQQYYDKALMHYKAVADKAPNMYAEEAYLHTARLFYEIKKDYTQAAVYFKQLLSLYPNTNYTTEALRGFIQCKAQLAQWEEALPYAQQLLAQPSLSPNDKMLSNLIIGKYYQVQENWLPALNAYSEVTSIALSEYSAEAYYRIAEIYFIQKNYALAEKKAFDVIHKAGSYDYWITKAYILLGNIYFNEHDYFNAEATLKSVAENATDTTLQKEAAQKLEAVLEEKKKNSKIESP